MQTKMPFFRPTVEPGMMVCADSLLLVLAKELVVLGLVACCVVWLLFIRALLVLSTKK